MTVPLLSRRRFAALLGGAALVVRAAPAFAAGPVVERTAKLGAAGLYELVVSRTTGLVHVAAAGTRGGNDAGLIGLDPATIAVRATIPLADAVFGLAVNDRTGTAYGTETRAGRLSAIDLRAGKVRASIGVGEGAHLRQPVVDEAGDRVFVTVFGFRDKPSAIWVVDAAAGTVATVIAAGLEGGITGLAHDPRNDRLFATALGPSEIVEVSLAHKQAVRRFPSGGEGAINLAFDPASNRLFCANQKSGQVSVLDAGSGAVVTVLDTGAGALGVTLSPDAALLYVANRGAGTVSVVDTRALTVLGSVATGTHPNTVAVDGGTGLAYVTNKARMGERGAPPPEDANGDTVSIVKA